MTKFVYRMQHILDLQLKLEEQAKVAFSLANQKLREEELKLQQIQTEIQIYKEKLIQSQTGVLDLYEMKRCGEAIELKKQQMQDQMKNIRVAERNVETARKKLNDVMVERKTQEILREKAFEEYVRQMNEEEMKATDELTSYRYNGSGKETDYA